MVETARRSRRLEARTSTGLDILPGLQAEVSRAN